MSIDGIGGSGERAFALPAVNEGPAGSSPASTAADVAMDWQYALGDAAAAKVIKAASSLLSEMTRSSERMTKSFVTELRTLAGNDQAAASNASRFLFGTMQQDAETNQKAHRRPRMRDLPDYDVSLQTKLGGILSWSLVNRPYDRGDLKKKRGSNPGGRHPFDESEHPEDADHHDYGADTYEPDDDG